MKRTMAVNGALVVLFVALVAGTWAWMARGTPEPNVAQDTSAATWYCPMHPEVVADRPGSCPICHMDLVRPEADPTELQPESAQSAERATVFLSEDRLRRLQARTVVAERTRFVSEIRATGIVSVDETRLREVHTKTSGFVETLHVNAVGTEVRRGTPLLEIYSPELLQAQEEFLVALRARARLAGSPDSGVAASSEEYVRAARRRLELLDVRSEDIAELEAGGTARRTVRLVAPIGGTVIARNVSQGSRVEPGTSLLTVADLGRVWVLAQVYEQDLPGVTPGQPATVELDYLPGRSFAGVVEFVYPLLDAGSRTARVRIALSNPDRELKPEMFATVRLRTEQGERLSVPRHAVLDTGTRQIVFVEAQPGAFEPREIGPGVRTPDRIEVLSGLREGDRVLAEGAFFVDSESRLRAALAGATHGATPAPPEP